MTVFLIHKNLRKAVIAEMDARDNAAIVFQAAFGAENRPLANILPTGETMVLRIPIHNEAPAQIYFFILHPAHQLFRIIRESEDNRCKTCTAAKRTLHYEVTDFIYCNIVAFQGWDWEKDLQDEE